MKFSMLGNLTITSWEARKPEGLKARLPTCLHAVCTQSYFNLSNLSYEL